MFLLGSGSLVACGLPWAPPVLLSRDMWSALRKGWDDLKRRLAANRRLYGFFHPSLPAEPLVLLHTALTLDVPAAMQDVLEQPPGT